MDTAAIINLNNSNLALAMSEEATKIACQGFIASYQSQPLVIAQAQQYAQCVSRIYPTQSETTFYLMSVLIGITIVTIATTVGWVKPKHNCYRVNSALGWALGSTIACLVAFLIAMTIQGLLHD